MNVSVVYQGDYHDENIHEKLDKLQIHLSSLVGSSCSIEKVEPWNSVKVTFSIPREAANKLKLMAMSNSSQLNDLGILSVQVEGESVIKLSFAGENGTTQQVVLQQQAQSQQQQLPERNHQQGPNVQMMNPAFYGGSIEQQHQQQQATMPSNLSKVSSSSAPKKRNRKPKEKPPAKSPKMNTPKSAGIQVVQSPVHADTVQQFIPANSTVQNGQFQASMPQVSSQLSPSVEQFVSDAWDKQMQQQTQAGNQQVTSQPVMSSTQNPDEEFKDIQLQSLLSGHNVTTGHNPAAPSFNNSFDGQPSNFPNMPSSVPMFSPDNSGMISSGKIHPIDGSGGFLQDIKPMAASVAGNVQSNASIASHLPAANMMGQQPMLQGPLDPNGNQTTKQNNTDPSNFTMQSTNPMSTSADISQPQMMQVAPNQWQPNPSMMQQPLPQGHMYKNPMSNAGHHQQPQRPQQMPNFHQQPGMVPPQNQGMQAKMPSPGSATPTQFPFFNNQQMATKPGEIQPQQSQEKAGTMASPLLVNLLQTEASAGLPGVTNQPPIMGPAQVVQKPKRKKPTRKKKTSKSQASDLPSPAGAMQYQGMFTNAEAGQPQQPPVMDNNGQQYMNPRFPQFKMQNQGQQVIPQNMNPNLQAINPMGKMNFPDSKASVIETISRSDVGSQQMAFARPPGAETMAQMPAYQRQGAVRPIGHNFQGNFDPSKQVMFQQKQNPQHQHMYINQMPGANGGQFAQFDQTLQRPMSIGHPHMQQPQMQHQQMVHQGQMKGPIYPMNPGGQFQPGMQGQSPMIPNQGQHFHMPAEAMQAQGMMNPAMGQGFVDGMQMQPNLNNSNNRPNLPQTSSIMPENLLPTLPPGSSHMVQYQQKQQTLRRSGSRSANVGRLPTGALSIIMKRSCVSSADNSHSPTTPQTQVNRPNSRSMQSKKSPGSSFDGAPFGSPSPKMAQHGVPSPRLQSPLMGSPSPIASHGSRSGTPKPRTGGAVPRNPIKQSPAQPRRPSLDQYMSTSPGLSRGFASAPNTPTNMPVTPTAPGHLQGHNFNYQDPMAFHLKEEHHQFYPHDPMRPNFWPQQPRYAPPRVSQTQQWGQGEYPIPLQTYPNPYPPSKPYPEMPQSQPAQARPPFDPNSSGGSQNIKSPRADAEKGLNAPVAGAKATTSQSQQSASDEQK